MDKKEGEEESYSEDDSEVEQLVEEVTKINVIKSGPVFENSSVCIACGSSSVSNSNKFEENGGLNDLIKRERVTDDEDGGALVENEFPDRRGKSPPRKSGEESKERGLFQNFCKLLGIKLTGVQLEGMAASEEGRGGEPEIVPAFCQICRNQLALLVDLQEKLKELERDLENGIQEFRKMCERAEDRFQESEVYSKRKIYQKIRKQICSNSVESETGEVASREPARKRTRRAANPSPINLPESPPTPTEDVCIKVEPDLPSSEEKDDNFHLEESSNSPRPSGGDSSDEYEPPAKKRPSPKPRKRVGRPPKPKTISPPPKRKKPPPPTKKTRRKSSKKDETDYAPSSSDEDSDIEASLKGRMSTDPVTGHVTFLSISFEALPSGRYRCLSCQKDSAYHRGSLKKHVITIHTDMFVCQECDQHCPSSKSLLSHVRRVHRGQDRTFVECPICGKPCSSKRGRMEKHMGTHLSPQEKEDAKARGEEIPQWSKKRRHVCEICGRGYELRSHLIQHKIREHPGTDYTEEDRVACKEMCPDCGKLVHRHYLKKHQEFVHSEGITKRFSCMLCEKRFSKESDLRKHKTVVHEKIKPFKCSLCPKQFALKTQMNYHMHTHQNIRPFQCDHCPMAFARKHHLERHLKIYHEPGANPKRKTYVKGPETKAKTEEELERESSGMGKVGRRGPQEDLQFEEERNAKVGLQGDLQMSSWMGQS